MELIRTIKQALDPQGILNAGAAIWTDFGSRGCRLHLADPQ